jgi:hypothetical protein
VSNVKSRENRNFHPSAAVRTRTGATPCRVRRLEIPEHQTPLGHPPKAKSFFSPKSGAAPCSSPRPGAMCLPASPGVDLPAPRGQASARNGPHRSTGMDASIPMDVTKKAIPPEGPCPGGCRSGTRIPAFTLALKRLCGYCATVWVLCDCVAGQVAQWTGHSLCRVTPPARGPSFSMKSFFRQPLLSMLHKKNRPSIKSRTRPSMAG